MPSISAVPKLDCLTCSLTSSSASVPTSSAVGSAALAEDSSSPLGTDTVPASISTETPIGTIITAVAVFETHMLRNAVASMNPPMTRVALVPIARTVSSAMRRCRFHRCMASAIRKPPMNRKMMSAP